MTTATASTERRGIGLPGLTWVALVSMLEALSFVLRLGPPFQPILSIVFVLTCPGFLILDLKRPTDRVAKAILGIATSVSVNVLIVTVALVGDRRWFVPGVALVLVAVAGLPREQLRSLMTKTPVIRRLGGRIPQRRALPAPAPQTIPPDASAPAGEFVSSKADEAAADDSSRPAHAAAGDGATSGAVSAGSGAGTLVGESSGPALDDESGEPTPPGTDIAEASDTVDDIERLDATRSVEHVTPAADAEPAGHVSVADDGPVDRLATVDEPAEAAPVEVGRQPEAIDDEPGLSADVDTAETATDAHVPRAPRTSDGDGALPDVHTPADEHVGDEPTLAASLDHAHTLDAVPAEAASTEQSLDSLTDVPPPDEPATHPTAQDDTPEPGSRLEPAVVVTPGRSASATEPAATEPPIDINTATTTELVRLPGIGPALAARIAAHRTTTGPFTTLDDLLVIPGISAAKLATIRPAAVAHPPATDHSADDHTADDQAAADLATDETHATEPPIDINIGNHYRTRAPPRHRPRARRPHRRPPHHHRPLHHPRRPPRHPRHQRRQTRHHPPRSRRPPTGHGSQRRRSHRRRSGSCGSRYRRNARHRTTDRHQHGNHYRTRAPPRHRPGARRPHRRPPHHHRPLHHPRRPPRHPRHQRRQTRHHPPGAASISPRPTTDGLRGSEERP